MKSILKTSVGAFALLAGAGMASAQDSGMSGTQQMASDITCSQIVALDTDELERALYFVAGYHAAQDETGMQTDTSASAAGSTTGTGAAMGTDTTASATDSGSDATTDMGTDTTASADSATTDFGSDSDTTASADTDTSGGATLDSGSDTTASADTDTSGGATLDSGSDTTASADTDTSGGATMDSGSDTTAADTTANTDTTTTAGTSTGAAGGGSGMFAASGYFEIPVEAVMTACQETPDSRVSDVLNQQNGTAQ